ncbi:MAG: hypothetical protein ACOX1P_17300 [Thermoguttaceae bacterium]|jgi:hypothetical protein
MSVPTQAISAMASKYAAAATPGRPISPSLTPAAAALARRFAEPRPKPTPTATAKLFRRAFGEFADAYYAAGLTFQAACEVHRRAGRQIRHPLTQCCGTSGLGAAAARLAGQARG